MMSKVKIMGGDTAILLKMKPYRICLFLRLNTAENVSQFITVLSTWKI